MKTKLRFTIEPLEARVAPAAYTWEGGTGNWSVAGNWINDATGNSDGTFPNGTDDSVTFDSLGGSNFVTIDAVYKVKSLSNTLGAITAIGGTGAIDFDSDTATASMTVPSGTLSIVGKVGLTDPLVMNISGSANVDIIGQIYDVTAAHPVVTKNGTGTLTYSGAAANTYTGSTQLQGGKLVLAKSTGVTALAGNVTISGQTSLETMAANVIGNSAVLTLLGTGTLKLGGDELIGSVAGTGGQLDLDGHTLALNLSTYAGGFLSDGTLDTGSIILTGTDTAAHTITLSLGGIVTVRGSYAAVNFTVPSGALAGDGSVGAFVGDGAIFDAESATGDFATLSVKSLGFTGDGVAYNFDLSDAAADKAVVRTGGTVALGGAAGTLTLDFTATPSLDQSFTLIDNQGSQPVSGTFLDVPEGTLFTFGGIDYALTYKGGDGNDVVLAAVTAEANISADGKTATFTDADGDAVTIKSSKGGLTVDRIKLTQLNALGGASVRLLDFTDPLLAGSNITITAKAAPRAGSLGDGFASVLRLNAGANALGVVKIDGDLAEIDAGAVKSLAVASLGLTTQPVAQSNLASLGALTVATGIHGADLRIAGALGAVKVGGSVADLTLIVGTQAGTVKIAGDLSDSIVRIAGIANPTAKTAVALKSLAVGGSLSGTDLRLGWNATAAVNPDVQAGAVNVKGHWIASSFIAGVVAGIDGLFGTADDAAIGGGNATVSKIARVTIGGLALGDSGPARYGIVAQQLGALKIAKAKAVLSKTGLDVLALGFTGDFIAREIA